MSNIVWKHPDGRIELQFCNDGDDLQALIDEAMEDTTNYAGATVLATNLPVSDDVARNPQHLVFEGGVLQVDPTHASAAAWRAAKSLALDELQFTDRVVLRCVERGVQLPADWVSYRATLRSIVSAQPAGTPPTFTRPALPV